MIILQFDNAYFHWGMLMLQSLQLHEPQTSVLCNTVNLTDHQTSELHNVHARVEVRNGVSDRLTTPEQMAARKPVVMQHVMQHYPEQPWYALLDADLLVRKPLDQLWSLLDDYPAALCITDGMENGTYYRQLVTPSGLVLLRPDAKKLIDCWTKWSRHDKPLYTIEPMAWYWDQVTLAEAWTETGFPCAVIPTHIYADEQLGESAAIWSANVPQKAHYYDLLRDEHKRQLDSQRAKLTTEAL